MIYSNGNVNFTVKYTLNFKAISARPNNIVASDETIFKVSKYVPELECFRLSKNASHPHINCYLIKEGIFAQVDYNSNIIRDRYNLQSDYHGMYMEWFLNKTRTQVEENQEPSLGIDFKTLGEAFREARIEANVSLKHLNDKYGINASYLSRVEKGKIADAFPGNYMLALSQEGISLDRTILKAITPASGNSAATSEQLNSLKILLPLLGAEMIGTIHQMVSSMVRTQSMDESNDKSLVTHMDVNRTGTE